MENTETLAGELGEVGRQEQISREGSKSGVYFGRTESAKNVPSDESEFLKKEKRKLWIGYRRSFKSKSSGKGHLPRKRKA